MAEQLNPDISEDNVDLLNRTWRSPPGFLGWFTHVNQSSIGIRFIITSLIFFALAGILALLMRLQLMSPENTLLGPEIYNQFFTVHGTAMMFFFAIPAMEGLGIYLVPLMIGTRDMCFPRLNAFGYYVYLIAGIGLFGSLFIGLAPDAGWFNYPTLAEKFYSPGKNIDVWTTLVTFIELSTLAAAVELIVTIFKQRAPGMSLNRMPLFVWAILVMSFMIVFAMPAVMLAGVMLELDRAFGTLFFIPEGGGDPLLWQHLFWFFGHPEVYIILVPALGIVSSVIITFTQRPIFGYLALVLSVVAIGFVSFGLWVHHMFTTGLPQLGLSFFMGASAMIAIPSGVQIFCWIASLWGAKLRFDTPMLFILGFFAVFVLGGLTGVMVASIPFDLQVHDTYFVIAHFHYVLIGGGVMPFFAGFYYWYPKFCGRMMSERLGRWSFWLIFIGFNITFFPMHQLGLEGMTRRVYTYVEGMGWDNLSLLATIGAFVIAFGFLLTFINALVSRKAGRIAGPNPWHGDSLEWVADSPPENCNFRHFPVVRDRYPVWEDEKAGEQGIVTGLRGDRRELLISTVLDAEPDGVMVMSGPTAWPFFTAVAVAFAFIGFIIHPWLFVAGIAAALLLLVGWVWPRKPWLEE